MPGPNALRNYLSMKAYRERQKAKKRNARAAELRDYVRHYLQNRHRFAGNFNYRENDRNLYFAVQDRDRFAGNYSGRNWNNQSSCMRRSTISFESSVLTSSSNWNIAQPSGNAIRTVIQHPWKNAGLPYNKPLNNQAVSNNIAHSAAGPAAKENGAQFVANQAPNELEEPEELEEEAMLQKAEEMAAKLEEAAMLQEAEDMAAKLEEAAMLQEAKELAAKLEKAEMLKEAEELDAKSKEEDLNLPLNAVPLSGNSAEQQREQTNFRQFNLTDLALNTVLLTNCLLLLYSID